MQAIQTIWPRQMGQEQAPAPAPAPAGPAVMTAAQREWILQAILDTRLRNKQIVDFMDAQPEGTIWPTGERGVRYDALLSSVTENMMDTVNAIDDNLLGQGPWLALTAEQKALLQQWLDALGAMYAMYRQDRPVADAIVYPIGLVAAAALAVILL